MSRSTLRCALRAALVIAFSFFTFGCVQRSVAAGSLPRRGERSAALASGGSLDLNIPVGTVRIRPAAGNELRLRYHIRPHHSFWSASPPASRAHLQFEVNGAAAVIRFSYPHPVRNSGSINVTIAVPRRISLHVNLGVGSIRIAGAIHGDKFLKTGVGSIRLGLGAKPDYRQVRISTGVGSIQGGPWGQGKGFVAKTLAAHPGGQYRLIVHAGVGSVRLHRG